MHHSERSDIPQPDGKVASGSLPIPEHNAEYAKKDYWDDRFAKEASYEWLGGYGGIASLIGQAIKKTDSILHVGVGNSGEWRLLKRARVRE